MYELQVFGENDFFSFEKTPESVVPTGCPAAIAADPESKRAPLPISSGVDYLHDVFYSYKFVIVTNPFAGFMFVFWFRNHYSVPVI